MLPFRITSNKLGNKAVWPTNPTNSIKVNRVGGALIHSRVETMDLGQGKCCQYANIECNAGFILCSKQKRKPVLWASVKHKNIKPLPKSIRLPKKLHQREIVVVTLPCSVLNPFWLSGHRHLPETAFQFRHARCPWTTLHSMAVHTDFSMHVCSLVHNPIQSLLKGTFKLQLVTSNAMLFSLTT
jgi:hypothetical protein